MTANLLVVCEAAADFRIASELTDRVLLEQIEWLEEGWLGSMRTWWGSASRPFVEWHELDSEAASRGVRLRPRSRFAGEPGAADAAAADKALELALLVSGQEVLTGVLLVRDTDGHLERRRGLEQARSPREGRTWPFEVVLAVAHPRREAWVLAGFEPESEAERERTGTLRRELGFDPCTESERLTASAEGAKREAKRVLRALLGDSRTREESCWQAAPLQRLRGRGQENGLTAFLAEVQSQIVPLIRRRR